MFKRLTTVYCCILVSFSIASNCLTQLAPNLRGAAPSAKELFEDSFVREGVLTKTSSRGTRDAVHSALTEQDTIEVTLFEDLTVTVVKSKCTTTKEGGLFWKGDCIRGEDGYMILYYANELLSGTLYSSDVVYNLNSLDKNVIRVVEADPTRIPEEHKECTHDHPERAWSPLVSPELSVDYVKSRPGKEVVDVMILYPPSIESLMGGASGMNTEVNKRIAEINDIFENSQIACEFNLVHHQPTTAVSSSAQGAQDVVKTEVINLRNQYKADIVSFWSGSGGSAGSGFNLDGSGSPDDGFNTSKFSLVQTYFTFVHESGHNMGAKHDRAAYSGKPEKLEVTPYYRYGKSFSNYRSVMSYDNCTGSGSCPRVPYFTNPEITVNGAPFGVTGNFQTYDVNGPADNSRRLNGTASIVSAWLKGSTVTTYSLSVTSGSGDGSYKSGAQVTITASAAPTGKVFDNWSGDTQYLADIYSATTTVTMPSKSISLTATYKTDLPDEYTLSVINGSGDGSYLEGAIITIIADDSSSAKKVFLSWSGDTQYLSNKDAATTTITMPAKSVSVTATYEVIEEIDSSNLSINLIQYAGWEGLNDSYGSKSQVDTTQKNDNSISAMIDLVADNAAGNEYSWAKVTAYLDSTFDRITLVKVRYTADKKIALVLEQEGLSDSGVAYAAELPAAAIPTTVYVPISRFKQPKWEGSFEGPLKLEQVSAISFEAKEKTKQTSLTLEELQFTNFEYNPVSTVIQALQQHVTALSALSAKELQITVPQALKGVVTIHSVKGQKILKKSYMLEAGSNSVALPSLPGGVYIVRLSGDSMEFTSRIRIK